MSTPAPMVYQYGGDGEFIALPRFRATCDQQYVVGEYYRLEDWEERSPESHSHQFAWLREAWKNLPEDLRDEYPTPKHLRKRALIDAGYFDEEIIDAGSEAAALRVRALARRYDDFAYVTVRGKHVFIKTAKSQKQRGPGAMDRKTFQASKEALLQVVSAMIGVQPAALVENADKAA